MNVYKATIWIKKNLPRCLIISVGSSGVFFFTFADIILSAKRYSFGIDQLSGLIISAIVFLSGILKLSSPCARLSYKIMLIVYFSGLLFMGLKPSLHSFEYSKQFLSISEPPLADLIVNILGFVPFSYLFLSFLLSSKRMTNIAFQFLILLVFVSGIFTSLVIESSQFYIPGRTSSLIDLLLNSIGTFIGITFFFLANRPIYQLKVK